MKRIRNWDIHVLSWAQSNHGKKFVWGKTDCATLARKACGVMYRSNLFPNIDEYSSLKEAKKVLNSIGSFEQVLLGLGCEPKSILMSKTGSIVIGQPEDEGFPTSMIYLRGSRYLCSIPEKGVFITRIPFSELKKFQVFDLPFEIE